MLLSSKEGAGLTSGKAAAFKSLTLSIYTSKFKMEKSVLLKNIWRKDGLLWFLGVTEEVIKNADTPTWGIWALSQQRCSNWKYQLGAAQL